MCDLLVFLRTSTSHLQRNVYSQNRHASLRENVLDCFDGLKEMSNHSFTAHFHITAFAIASQLARPVRAPRLRTRHERDAHIDLDGDSNVAKTNGAQHPHCADRNRNDIGREDDCARDGDSDRRGGARNRNCEQNTDAEAAQRKPRSRGGKVKATAKPNL